MTLQQYRAIFQNRAFRWFWVGFTMSVLGDGLRLTIWAQTLRMQIIPAHLRGRTFALLRMLMQSGHPVGGALAGGLFPLLGMTTLIALTALVAGAPGGVGYLVRDLRVAGSRPTVNEEVLS